MIIREFAGNSKRLYSGSIQIRRRIKMYNILVCDDEKDIVSALKIYLKTSGYNIYEAYNGKEALERIKEHDIHLVLMDIMMPEMDGITAMLKIRE